MKQSHATTFFALAPFTLRLQFIAPIIYKPKFRVILNQKTFVKLSIKLLMESEPHSSYWLTYRLFSILNQLIIVYVIINTFFWDRKEAKKIIE
jgi:hypothetical protein